MKKLKLKNLKVVKLTKEEKKTIKGGGWDTSAPCDGKTTGPYISWCNYCGEEDQ